MPKLLVVFNPLEWEFRPRYVAALYVICLLLYRVPLDQFHSNLHVCDSHNPYLTTGGIHNIL